MSIDEALAVWRKNLKSAPMTSSDHVRWVKRSNAAIASMTAEYFPPTSADGPEAEVLAKTKSEVSDPDPVDDNITSSDVLDAGENEEPEEKPPGPMAALRGGPRKRKAK